MLLRLALHQVVKYFFDPFFCLMSFTSCHKVSKTLCVSCSQFAKSEDGLVIETPVLSSDLSRWGVLELSRR